MAALIESLHGYYNHIFFEQSDKRMIDYPLMGSPVPMALIISGYYIFVKKLCPWLMENRKPFDVKTTMIVYNFGQCIINVYLVYFAGNLMRHETFSFICHEVTDTRTEYDMHVMRGVYLFFLIKLSDLTDTIFMALRKNYHQITFLHVYHHILMAIFAWIITKYIPGGQACFFGLVNAFVHSIMYGYYLLTAKYPEYKKSIWWKKNITQMQLIQFCILCIHHSIPFFVESCSYPKIILIIFLSQDIFMMYLFSKFYYNAYLTTNKSKTDLKKER